MRSRETKPCFEVRLAINSIVQFLNINSRLYTEMVERSLNARKNCICMVYIRGLTHFDLTIAICICI